MSVIRLDRDMQADAALVLWATGGLDTLDIAQLTGMREGEVYNTIARARGQKTPDGKDGSK